MGLDPGYRTGCKMAIVDATGQVLDHGVLYITMSDDAKAKSAQKLLDYIQKYKVNLISIGNGTASYETEEFVANLINEHKLPVHYLITNEAGASVYSASKLAVEELPEYDVTIRGAISIARRIQDPLAELVKIEPKAIGVGQYQHDVNQKELANTLDAVIEAAVNHVGVELNTASAALLKHIAGINATVAKNIIKYRDEHGIFASRKELLKVSRLGPTAYTQCAGFLRINGATCPLDNTPVHPESYPLAEQILAELGFSLEDLADKYADFKNIDCEIYSVSCDTHFVHKAWHDASDTIKKIKYTMLADPTGLLARAFDVMIEDDGIAERGSFIVNPEGKIVAYEVIMGSVGRNADELLRRVEAAQFVAKHGGEVCPARWKLGAKTLKPSIELVGNI